MGGAGEPDLIMGFQEATSRGGVGTAAGALCCHKPPISAHHCFPNQAWSVIIEMREK